MLGLIFLRFADAKFKSAREGIEAKASARRTVGPSDYHAQRVLYLTEAARFDSLLALPEGADLGKARNDAMRAVEEHNPHLSGVLPRAYTSVDNGTLASLLRHINGYTKDREGDAFGLIYASSSRSNGRILDPACGSGGMFVHSAHFVERHRQSPGDERRPGPGAAAGEGCLRTGANVLQ